MPELLIVVAALFAVTAGANDGSSILAAGLRVPGLRPIASISILLGAIVVGPLFLFGTGVATTLTHRLVPFSLSGSGETALVAAALGSLCVIFVLNMVGLPSSLTLALIGAIAGAGFGSGLTVSRSTLLEIIALGLFAPLLAMVIAFAIARFALGALEGSQVTRRTRFLHVVAFALQCLAYSANGGQKMLAVSAIAVGAVSGSLAGNPWWLVVVVALLFGIGVLTGLRRISATLSQGVLAVHLRHALVAETSSFAVVMSASLVGVPLTMSQSVAGALVGVGVSESRHRIRWSEVTRILGAWLITLPASMIVAAVFAAVLRWR